MSNASSPNPRYFKASDGGYGTKPNWRFALRWPRRYLWMVSPRWVKNIRFAAQRRRRG
jgi:hypothetical protein